MTQTFYEYMANFLEEKNIKSIVEIGSDMQLKLAMALSHKSNKFYSVNFPEDHAKMKEWYDLAREMGGFTNIELISGNAVELPRLIKHTDAIILQNVLIDGNGTDARLMWQYRNGERQFSEKNWADLRDRFVIAEENAYKGFLEVAKPGYIIRFGRPAQDKRFQNMLIDKLGVNPARIQTKDLLYDETSNPWEAYFVDNS